MPTLTSPTVTLLGLGAMGSRMAHSLLKAGYALTVWNRTPERMDPLVQAGAIAAETPRAAVQNTDIVISMVRDDAASRYIWQNPELGALAGLASGSVVIESSTLTVAWVRELATLCQAQNLCFLDAPVVGSRPQAEAGQLIYLVGGDMGVLSQVESVLKVIGGSMYHAGPAGCGTAVKLAINTLFSVQLATMGELITLLRLSGVDPVQAVNIIAATPVCSPAVKIAAGAMLAQQFTPLFPIELVAKDLQYTLETAQASEAWTPMTEVTHQLYRKAQQVDLGRDNITGVIQLFQAHLSTSKCP